MKRLFFISICIVFFMTSTALHAQEKAPLGNGNFAVKLDYIVFTNDHFDEAFNQDDGLYIGLEGYGLEVVERIPLETESTVHNKKYLNTKKEKMGHLLKGV